jgi:adenylate cyclase
MAQGTQRRLAAIVSADVVGYSRLMGVDEAGTLATMRAHREDLWNPIIERFGGRVVGTAGDAILVEYASAVAAVESSIAVQQGMAERNADLPDDERMLLRIGINVGEVIIEGDDIFGDGVNVAARLQALSEPGGISLSDDAHRQVRDRMDVSWKDGGEHEVKNIARPVHVWRWLSRTNETPASAPAEAPLALPDKPSIAVLPFENMSGDPDQEYFSDGITEEITTALSRFRSLFVIARNSSYTYKGKAIGVTDVGRELGVRYVIEGSVRKADNKVRITAQLVEAEKGNHLWADRYDGELEDVFDLQDRLTEQIVIAVEPEVQKHELDRSRRKPPENVDAWTLLQRGLSHFYRITKEDHAKAISLFQDAVAKDSNFAMARAHLAYSLWASVVFGYADDVEKNLALARQEAEQAAALDQNEPVARYTLGRLYIFDGELELGIGEMQAAISINPNYSHGHYGIGWAYYYGAGDVEKALPYLETALRLNPRDPIRWVALGTKGLALSNAGHFEEAISVCRQACQFTNASHLSHMHLAATLANSGQIEQAAAPLDRALELEPDVSIGFVRKSYVRMHERPLDHLLEGLRKAGLQE